MSHEFLDRIEKLSPKRLALLAHELHEQLEAARERESIAVIGIGCRFPGGADNPQAFWELLRAGRDAIREVPADRWKIDDWFDADPDAPARMSVRNGGFLDRIDGFDAAFFGIAPREAITMDPQQRLALEVAWEALEHAGLAPEQLAGSATGVFLGICNSDHTQRVLARGDAAIDAYLASGNAHSVASGRIAYFLGLQGPALSIDTACSSSLVALHVACTSLRSGESRLALAGGVNLMCAPQVTVALTKAHMLAPDGRCKTFDASADGFSRGEGCGMLVLKRLADAQADGDRVLAVIRGTAANQDGRSGGLTVPNGPAQEAVIRAALADAKLAPADIGYVEAHGTGTSLGDPIEVRALAGALGAGRSAQAPLLIGSVKTNIGHLESAAGIAGVIKTVLALQQEHLPKHLHFTQPSPHIAWADHPVRVVAEDCPWPRGAVPRRAGISSFGFSGTNAHVIVEEAPAVDESAAVADRPLHVLPLSARTPQALRELARQMAGVLGRSGASLADIAFSAGTGRSHFTERLAVVADTAASACEALLAFVRGEAHAALIAGSAQPGQPPELVFMFTGQGSQYPGMGERLYTISPVYRAVIDECETILGADAQGRTLKTVLFGAPHESPPEGSAIHETGWTQPALFAVEYAVTQLWRSWGIEPAAVIGHSVGEYIAACVAGVFPLADGLRLIAERGRLMQALPPGGSMAALYAPADEVARAVTLYGKRLAIAAFNAPDSVVVSGDTDAVDTLLADFATRHVQGQRLFVSLAAHSARVEPALDAMQACAARVVMHSPRLPVAWNLTGGPLASDTPDSTYWRRHLREPVRFGDAIAWLYAQGYRTFLEVGPHPTLAALAQRTLPESGTHLSGSLRRGKDDWHELMLSLAGLYVRGARIDWAGVAGTPTPRRVALPTYPFERRSFWIGDTPLRTTLPATQGAHPLVGTRLATAVPTFEAVLAPDHPAWLGEHRVHGMALVAGPVFLEMAQACAAVAFGSAARRVDGFVVRAPLVLDEGGRVVQLHFSPNDAAGSTFEIHSRAADAAGVWVHHASGRLRAVEAASPEPINREAFGPVAPCDTHYQRLAALGITLGLAWQSLKSVRRSEGALLVQLALDAARAADPVAWAHPALFDGALQAVGLALPDDSDELYLLSAIDAIELDAALPPTLEARVSLRPAARPAPAEWQADVDLFAADGSPLGRIGGVRLRRAPRDALLHAVGRQVDAGLGYRVDWEPVPARARAAPQLVPPAQFMNQVGARFDTLALQHGIEVYAALQPELDALSALHVSRALHSLGLDTTPGRRFSADLEAQRLRIVPQHRRLFGRMLQMLVEDGVLAVRDGGHECLRVLDAADPMPRYAALKQRFALVDAELSVLRRCGSELARVLRGEQDALQLLFPGGSFAEARRLYVESPFARTYNGALAAAVESAIAALPATARLRVLEIGAGTGGTTGYVLPLLPADRTDYCFTDLSSLFLERAATRFTDHPFVERRLLDIERDPKTQGFELACYDIVIAANVLHACADLRAAVAHARDLLAPGGQLLLLEGLRPERWVDLSFGLTEGWWRFTDTRLRKDYPLIDRAAWFDLLGELGFTEVAAVPGSAQQALIVARAPLRTRRWTLVGGPDALVGELRARLEARGDSVSCRSVDDASALPPGDDWVWLGALDGGGIARAVAALLQALAQLVADPGAGRAWLVTQGAHHVMNQSAADSREQLPLWGVGRVFALEQPARWGGAIDLPPEADTASPSETLLAGLDSDDGEDQTAWRNGQRLACRLVPAALPDTAPPTLRADASYLVTGGFGGLGLLAARWLVERGARHIVLLGRHPDMIAPGVRELEALGAQVIGLAGDVADEASMRGLLAQVATHAPPVRGVLHLAADMSAAPLTELSEAQITTMLRPKVEGTRVLERLAQSERMDFLVLFSSTTALLGASGLAHYAAANLFLDATAERARADGRPVLSVAWGTWDAMRRASRQQRESFRRGGPEPMDNAAALDALGRLMASGTAHAVVARIDAAQLRAVHEARRPRPFLRRLGQAKAVVTQSVLQPAGPTASDLARRVAAAPADLRHDLLVGEVSREVAAVLALLPGSPVAPSVGLFDLGMDSLMAVELKRRLEHAVGHALPSTLTFNYPNVAALAAFLETEIGAPAEPAPVIQSAPRATPAASAHARALDELSEEELEHRLLARLDDVR